ncbi:MAG: 3'-5' exonuclease [Bacteroidetes bacterium]|nr:3'-5' exonuclease [Bacteroidota bacterium]
MNQYIQDCNDAIKWAQGVLESPNNYVILDTETTGIGNDDRVIEISVIDLDKKPLINTRIKLTDSIHIPKEAYDIHGITAESLADAPALSEIYNDILKVLQDKIVLIYNAEFDLRLLKQTFDAEGLELPAFESQCVMIQYSKFKGVWSDKYGDYLHQKLVGGDHSAFGDCKATLKTILKLSKSKMKVPEFTIGNSIRNDLLASLSKGFEDSSKSSNENAFSRFFRKLFK